jgi:hypothetical protein
MVGLWLVLAWRSVACAGSEPGEASIACVDGAAADSASIAVAEMRITLSEPIAELPE